MSYQLEHGAAVRIISETKPCKICGASIVRSKANNGQWRRVKFCSQSCRSRACARAARARKQQRADA